MPAPVAGHDEKRRSLAARMCGCYHPRTSINPDCFATMADKKPQRLKARLPRGLTDRGPGEIAATRRMIETISKQYELYGFEPVETPAIEYTDALGKFLPDQDRPNEGVFSFQDDDEQWLSLRYDLTAPLARHVAENFQNIALPYRSYRYGWVFRNEKPGPGRYRQFMQFDADTVGSASPAADAEMCMLAADTMEALGIPRGSYVVKVNNRKVLDGVMEAANIPENKRLTVLRAIDKRDKFPLTEVEKLLGDGRLDESGDFTKGAGLLPDQIQILRPLLQYQRGAAAFATDDHSRPEFRLKDSAEANLANNSGSVETVGSENAIAFGYIRATFHPVGGDESTNIASYSGYTELAEIARLTHGLGYEGVIVIDPSVVRGLEYYTGPVYEVELTLETKDEKGRPVRFGSVGGGGRYDGLVSRFRGEPVPATGFSIGVSRLMAALTLLKKIARKPEPGPVLVTVFDQSRVADYQRMVQTLRKEGIRAEMYLGSKNHGIGQQLKYADKRGAPCAIIQGGDEKAKGEVQIKDLILGAEIAGLSKEREDYLKKQAQAQFAVPEDKLVDAVRELLARHQIKH
jgi:histidyl-tRNA synthetase